ncbi:MAG: DUF748 domain-containing protein [Rhodoferax sp.]|nr:MAG: DUF748 domain-containing protein [Rhodoferax sp.]
MEKIAHLTKLSQHVPPKLQRTALWLTGGVLALWLLAWAAVPSLLKAQAEKIGSDVLGRPLSIGSVDLRPWSLEVTLHDLRIGGAPSAPQTPLLEVARVYVDAEMASLWHLAPVIDALEIEAPHVRVTHLGAGRYDFDDVLARLSAPQDPPSTSPARFALYNLEVRGGEIDFTDTTPRGAVQHSVRKLHLALPFVSTLPTQRNVKVEPRLALEVNGSAWDSAAQATPFAEVRQGEVQLQLQQLDVKPYLPYWPAGLPLRMTSAVLDADVRAQFVQSSPPSLVLSGSLGVRALALADPRGQPVLELEALRVQAQRIEPLAGVVALASVEVDAPRLQLERLANGRFNLDTDTKPARNATKKEATEAVSMRADGQNGMKKPVPHWRLNLQQFKLQGGVIQWRDRSTKPQASLALEGLDVQAEQLSWPQEGEAAKLQASARIPGKKPAELRIAGQGGLESGDATVELQQLALGLGAPYLAQYLLPTLEGTLDAQAAVRWKGTEVQATLERLRVRELALSPKDAKDRKEGAAMPRIQSLEVDQAQVDLARQSVHVGRIRVQAPSAEVERDAQGQWMFERWLVPTAAAPVQAAAPKATPWDIQVDELALDGGAVRLRDRSLRPVVRLDVSALQIKARKLTAHGKTPAQLSVAGKVQSGQVDAGQLQFQGNVAWAPVAVQGKLRLQDLPAHAVAPYVADRLNVEIVRADANFSGNVQYQDTAGGPQLAVDADMALEDLRVNTQRGDEGRDELLSWKALNLPGVALRMVPGAALQLKVREVGLNDFYARVIVSPQGRLNLQDIVKTEAPVAAATPAAVASAPAAASAPALDPVIDIGPVTLAHGRVQFSDRFIQPNYSANLSELNGRLSQFSSRKVEGVVQLADLDVRGRAEGTASLAIVGKVNPLAQPLALDIQGKVRDLELSPLSPYAIKYAGYGIERGKMSVDVGYKVQPDGKLDATNNIVLNQLQFGDKVEGAPNSLPVKLAVALLADRNGVIDINLPISGSLNDPEFKLGAVIWKVITNLIVKAVTAPFNLLAGAFGGGGADETGAVPFANGKSELGKEASTTLDKLAKALLERPAIRMTVVGQADMAVEREAIRRERLNTLLLAEKRRRAVADGKDAAAVLTVDAGEYSALLRQVYRRSDVKKPRNLVGLVKDLPDAEMEKLLLDSLSVNEESVRALALARGVAVKEYLVARQVPVERVFLGAIKTSGLDATWSPRAEMALTMQ